MLSDAEQRRLVEIERSLMVDDPRLARRLARPRSHRRPSVAAVVVIVVISWITTASALTSGSVFVATAGLFVMVATAGFWAARRRR